MYGRRRVIKPRPDKDGYLRAAIWTDGKRRYRAVHTLVATAFHGPALFAGAQVRHLDGDNTNNAASNLQWGTHAENMADRHGHGNNAVGTRNGRATINETIAAEIKRMLRERTPRRVIVQTLGVSEGVIAGIVTRGNWKHVA